MTIGDSIKALRKSRGLTQKELAEKLGVSASMIGQYETNVRKPKLETLAKIATTLGANITELVDLSDISPSLNAAVPLIDKFGDILDRAEPGTTIILSEDERSQLTKLAELIGNFRSEVLDSSFLINTLKTECISYLDKLNFYGHYLALQMLSKLASDSELTIEQQENS